MSISSDSLFHFTDKLDTVLSIIENGFRYNLLEEEVPFSGFPGGFFSIPGLIKYINTCTAICFCDIPLPAIKNHREQYGSYLLGLKKEWGIKNGVTPIRYIHYYTPDINNDKYRKLKDSYMMFQQHQYVPFSFYLHVLKDMGDISEIPTEEDISNLPPFVLKAITIMNAQLLEMAEYILYSQGFLRAYEGEWNDQETGKIVHRTFYDEREWRIIQTNEKENYLPFSFADINHILVLEKSEKDIICEFMIDHFQLKGNDKNEVWYKVKIWKDFEKDFIGL
jgi:Putative abortive phage resistance protein AbiGi, antitoxin